MTIKQTFALNMEKVLLARILLRGGVVPQKYKHRNLNFSMKVQRKLLKK